MANNFESEMNNMYSDVKKELDKILYLDIMMPKQ